jgi:hypothetical protein
MLNVIAEALQAVKNSKLERKTNNLVENTIQLFSSYYMKLF